MNLYKISSTVINITEKIIRDFLWQGKPNTSSKIHLVKWDKICKHKKNGGIGVNSIRKHVAFLVKWWWRHKVEGISPGIRIVEGKYGGLDKCSTWQRFSSLSPIMHSIMIARASSEMKLFEGNDFQREIGKGIKIKFWEDH